MARERNRQEPRTTILTQELDPSESDYADAVADRLAAGFKCYNGPAVCEGRNEFGMVRHRRCYRGTAVYLAGGTIAPRVYQCRFCGVQHVFAVEVPKPQ